MTWRVAKSLLTLRDQVNATWPNRSKDSDGTIGNAEHAARSSDHNPWVKDGDMGIVTAEDFTHDPAHGFDSYAFAEMLRQVRDHRIKYVISNRRIWNSEVAPFQWRPYHGSNPHDHHVHISVKSDKAHYDSTAPWVLSPFQVAPPPPISTPPAPSPIKLGDTGYSVEYLQRMLGAPQTGVFDEDTKAFVAKFQNRYGLTPDGIVGPKTWKQLEA